MLLIRILIACHIFHYTHEIEVAKEVEGGVQLLNIGSVELILPEILSFTVKNTATCTGQLRICYAASRITKVGTKHNEYFNNIGNRCPPNSCTIKISGDGKSCMALGIDKTGDTAYAKFYDNNDWWCPRNVVNNRQSFNIFTLPQCPVIVNDARLPEDENKKTSKTSSVKWIVMGCVGIFLLFIIVSIIGFCIYTRSKE